MANILTAAEAAAFIRTATSDTVMTALLPMVDEYLFKATGHDWANDTTIDPAAKLAAGTLLTAWYDNPAMVGNGAPANALLATLEARALAFRKYAFAGLNGAGSIYLEHARKGDVVMSLIGTYGVSGDQKASFAASIADDQVLLQLSGSDLSDNLYSVVLKHPADDVKA